MFSEKHFFAFSKVMAGPFLKSGLCENTHSRGVGPVTLTPDPWSRNRDDDRTPIGPGDV